MNSIRYVNVKTSSAIAEYWVILEEFLVIRFTSGTRVYMYRPGKERIEAFESSTSLGRAYNQLVKDTGV